jgi:hypothetical protein
MNLLLEKSSPKEYAIEDLKRYELEKNFQKNSTHIFLKKESEYASVKRIIGNFKKRSSIEFMTIFKLYKFQNYKYSPEYLLGTHYKYGSLNCMSTYVKAATKDLIPSKSSDTAYHTAKIIYDFIQDIKSFSSPFPYIFSPDETKKGISELVESGTLTQEEIDFINYQDLSTKPKSSIEEISCGKTNKNKKIKKEKQVKIDKNSKEQEMSSRTLTKFTKSDYMVIVNNYKLGTPAVSALLPHLNKRTLFNYVKSCELLASNIVPKILCPKMLVDCFNEVKNNTLSINISNELKSPIFRRGNKNKQSSNTQFVIMDRNHNVIKMSDNEMFIRGFKEGSRNKSWKIYRIVEV